VALALHDTTVMSRRKQRFHAELAGVHVLLVEDEPDCLEMLRAVLEYCGALVTGALSADEALNVMRRVKPDVLVSDVMMPERDGYWLIRRVRALSPEEGGATPAIVVTALALRDHGPAVERTREEHRQLAGEILVELLPRLVAGTTLEGGKQHLRSLLRPLTTVGVVHGEPP